MAEILLRSWRRDPDLVRVLVLEVTRSPVLAGEIDELLTGWVLGRLAGSDDDLARAERTVVAIVTGGLAADHAGTPA